MAENIHAGPIEQPYLTGYVHADTEKAIRGGIEELTDEDFDLHRGGLKAAIEALEKGPSPEILIIDISGERDAVSSLRAMRELVVPTTSVLLVGDIDNTDFYREVTQILGAEEYLAKPFTRERVARVFSHVIRKHPVGNITGRCIAVMGARGGVGTSVIASSLAWLSGAVLHRHSLLLDTDLHRGVGGFLLNCVPGHGLRQALEDPERIDVLLAERASVPAAERLHLMAESLPFLTGFSYQIGAAESLLGVLSHRFHTVIVDIPTAINDMTNEFARAARQKVIVMEPTLASVRDATHLLNVPAGPLQDVRPIIILNKLGKPGYLTRKEVEDALKMSVDLVIPDIPKHVIGAAMLGKPVIDVSPTFKNAIIELGQRVDAVGASDLEQLGVKASTAGGLKDTIRKFFRR